MLNEYDYLTNSYTEVSAPGGGLSTNQISLSGNMLDLPDGTVLYASDAVTPFQYYVYVPSGDPLTSGKPIISSITLITCTSLIATGRLFNGINEGAAFGDEGENDSNYPLVRLTSSTGHVYYARSDNCNSTGVQRGLKADTSSLYSVTAVGTVEISANENTITVSPNPSIGTFDITISAVKNASLRIKLNDAIGRHVFTELTTTNEGKNILAIDDNNLANGIYFLKVEIGVNKNTRKIIIN